MDMIGFAHGFHFRNELWVLLIPVALMSGDSITGFLKAWNTKTFTSSKMRSGLTKKAGEILLLVVGEILTYGLQLPDYVTWWISAYIIIMEIMSIFENLKQIGVPIPEVISKVLHTVDETLKAEDVSEAVKKISELEKEVKMLQGGKKTEESKQ